MLNRTTSLLLSTTLVLSLLTISTDLSAQEIRWERVDRTDEGPIEGVDLGSVVEAADGSLLLSAGDGLYRITDLSGSDGPLVERLLPGFFGAISVDGETLRASGLDAIFRSGDNGESWDHHFTIPKEESVLDIRNDTLLLVRYNAPAHLRRVDLATGASDTIPFPHTTLPLNLMLAEWSGYLYYTSIGFPPPSFLLSSNWGETWEEITATWPEELLNLQFFRVLSDSLLIAGHGNKLVISADNGRTWRMRPAYPGHTVLEVTFENNVLSVLSAAETGVYDPPYTLYRSVDTGATWETCITSYSRQTGVLRNERFYTERDGVFAYASGCRTEWMLHGEGFRNISVEKIQSSDDLIYATIIRQGVADGEYGKGFDLYRSENDGVTWTLASSGVSGPPVIDGNGILYMTVDTAVVEVIDGEESSRRVRTLIRSTDGGDTWSRTTGYEVGYHPELTLEISTAEDGTLLARTHLRSPAGSGQTLVSTDSGATFRAPGGWTDSGAYRPASMVLRPDGKILSVGSRWAGKGKYIDYGFNLLDPTTGETEWLGGPDLNYLQISEDGTVYGWRIGVLKKSEDGGRTWTDLTMPALITDVANNVVEKPGGLLFLERGSELHLSRDGGSNWTPYTPPVIGVETIDHWRAEIPLLFIDQSTILDLVHLDETDSLRANFNADGDRLYHHQTLLRSRDNGVTWDSPLPLELESLDITTAALGRNRTLVIGTRNNGIYRATLPSSVDEEIRAQPSRLDLQ